MKRIKNKTHSNKDRIICINTQDKHFFYYQAEGVKEAEYLFETKASPSISLYFHSKGHPVTDDTAYLTIGELYRFCDYHNVKLAHTLERIPGLVDFILTHEYSRINRLTTEAEYSSGTYSDERVA